MHRRSKRATSTCTTARGATSVRALDGIDLVIEDGEIIAIMGPSGTWRRSKRPHPEFLANKRVAVTGVSRHPESHGSNVVYQRLRERGYEVFAVNPNADEVEGDRCYHDLRSIPGGVDAVVIATRPEIADETMRDCADLGIKHVWMHRGPGAGSVSGQLPITAGSKASR